MRLLKNYLKEILVVIVALLTIITFVQGYRLRHADGVVSGLANQKSPDIFSTTGKNFITSLYVEYAFDSGEDKDLGFTK